MIEVHAWQIVVAAVSIFAVGFLTAPVLAYLYVLGADRRREKRLRDTGHEGNAR